MASGQRLDNDTTPDVIVSAEGTRVLLGSGAITVTGNDLGARVTVPLDSGSIGVTPADPVGPPRQYNYDHIRAVADQNRRPDGSPNIHRTAQLCGCSRQTVRTALKGCP